MPDIVPFLPKLKDYYPSSKFILMQRNIVEVINSVMLKGWFKRENDSLNLVWPFTLINNTRVPFWVEKDDQELWTELNEVDRCAYYMIRMGILSKNIDCFKLNYHQLLEKPVDVAEQLAQYLETGFGNKTHEVLETVKPTKKDCDLTILESVSIEFRNKIKGLEEYS